MTARDAYGNRITTQTLVACPEDIGEVIEIINCDQVRVKWEIAQQTYIEDVSTLAVVSL